MLGVSKSRPEIGHFENLPMFYPPEGLCGAEPERGPIVFTLDFIGVDYHTGIFKITSFRWLFWNLENVLSPGGTLQSRARKGSNCFYLCFIPRREAAKAAPKGSTLPTPIKWKEYQLDPYWKLQADFPSGDKIFSGIFFGEFPPVNWKVSKVLLTQNKT